MKKLLLLLVLSLLALEARSAAPVISCTPSRTSGTAPLGVILDCTGTTDSDTSNPFHDLFYVHTFGDPSAGLWTTGANTALSKNFATGAIAGHIYETAGTYTITSTVSDGTNIARTTNTITVSDPDSTYSGTATVCFSTSGTFTGCPAGATQTTSSDFDTAAQGCIGATKRCLFRRGETFDMSATVQFATAGPATIGAYGSGAKPIITSSANVEMFQITSTSVNDHRVMDLDMRGGGNSASLLTLGVASASGITFLRVDATSNFSSGINVGDDAFPITNFFIQDSTIPTVTTGYGIFGTFISSAILGNSIGPFPVAALMGIRLPKAQKTVIAYNTVTTQGTNTSIPLVTIRAPVHTTNADDSFYNIVSDNKLSNANSTVTNSLVLDFSIGAGLDERIYDNLIERNWFLERYIGADTGGCIMVRTHGTRNTYRNNFFDTSASTTCETWSLYTKKSGTQNADGNTAYNNTFWSGTSTAKNQGMVLDSGSTNTVLRNNLCYFPSAGVGTVCVGDFGTGTTSNHNTADAGCSTVTTDPSFDNTSSLPIGMRIGTGSYAASCGVAIFPPSNDDFYHCDDTTSNERIGMFVPRTRATCRGAAGP